MNRKVECITLGAALGLLITSVLVAPNIVCAAISCAASGATFGLLLYEAATARKEY